MATWELVVLIVVAVLLVLFAGGYVANARLRRERGASLAEEIAAADHALAVARAADRGWDPALLEAAARTAFAARHPGVAVTSLDLVQVVDRPGTEQDVARMRVGHAGGWQEIELRRTGDTWAAA